MSGHCRSLKRDGHLLRLVEKWRHCKGCELWKTRTMTVHWRGSPYAKIAFVGEAPGANEDRTGIPFVGDAGELFDSILKENAFNLRDDVFICNVLACRPPGNRDPMPHEAAACRARLNAMLAIVQPKVVVMLGASAGKQLAGLGSVGQWRGSVRPFEFIHGGEILKSLGVLTYHPAYLLRNPQASDLFTSDLLLAREAANG